MSTGFRQPFYFLGQYRNIPWLRSYMEFPQCQMHPETCEKYGVEDGDIIWIESPRGRIRQKLRAFPGIKKDMIMCYRQLVLSRGTGEGLPRRVHLQPERADEQRPPRPDVRLARTSPASSARSTRPRTRTCRTRCSAPRSTAPCRPTASRNDACRLPARGATPRPPRAGPRTEPISLLDIGP